MHTGDVSRRVFLQGAGVVSLLAAFHPVLAFADAATDNRLVVIILRGAMDGLAAVPPYGDPSYTALRGDLALASDTLLKLDDRFALHPSLKPLHDLYAQKQLAVIHAVSSPYRERSHFDGQNVLELGGTQPHDLKDGWLNRVAGAINARSDRLALAIGDGVPLMLRGSVPVGSWVPQTLPDAGQDFMSMLQHIYQDDPAFAKAFASALDLQAQGTDALKGSSDDKIAMQKRNQGAFVSLAGIAGNWLARPDGPRLATLELTGWDTHVQQGTEGGRMAGTLDLLARGIDAIREKTGPVWSRTTVVTLTEFGRTARPNGTHGTDHGTASAMFVAGGAVRGGLYGGWPGLLDNALYQGRDLMPATDLRSVMKGILSSLYGLPPATLDHDIYPNSGQAIAIRGLIGRA